MTLEEAKELVSAGRKVGDVWPACDEKERLAAWFVGEPAVPNLVARGSKPAAADVVFGNLCRCGGFMVRTGTCETCQSCGTSSGGCG